LGRHHLTALVIATALTLGCGDNGDDTGAKGSETGAAAECLCTDEGTVLTDMGGCENFGGDQEECSGWESCLLENEMSATTVVPSGTVLTCFGCSIKIEC
jgi:hypothetical protein